jgi:hypothetical protein
LTLSSDLFLLGGARSPKRVRKRLRICSAQPPAFQLCMNWPLRPADSHQAYSSSFAWVIASWNSSEAAIQAFSVFTLT